MGTPCSKNPKQDGCCDKYPKLDYCRRLAKKVSSTGHAEEVQVNGLNNRLSLEANAAATVNTTNNFNGGTAFLLIFLAFVTLYLTIYLLIWKAKRKAKSPVHKKWCQDLRQYFCGLEAPSRSERQEMRLQHAIADGRQLAEAGRPWQPPSRVRRHFRLTNNTILDPDEALALIRHRDLPPTFAAFEEGGEARHRHRVRTARRTELELEARDQRAVAARQDAAEERRILQWQQAQEQERLIMVFTIEETVHRLMDEITGRNQHRGHPRRRDPPPSYSPEPQPNRAAGLGWEGTDWRLQANAGSQTSGPQPSSPVPSAPPTPRLDEETFRILTGAVRALRPMPTDGPNDTQE